MTFGSLFAGIGGMDLGLERAGMRCVWQVEIDDYCRRVLERHWPDVRRWDDVRTFPPFGEWGCDLLAGGPPCQPVSVIGNRMVQDDKRWLWPEFKRIIRTIGPRFVLVENVAGLLVRGIGDVLGDLAQMGFDAEWFCVQAAQFGAPHQRERVFVAAWKACDGLGPLGCVRTGAIRGTGDLPQRRPGGRRVPGRRRGLLPGGVDTQDANLGSERLEKRKGIQPRREDADTAVAACDVWGNEPDVGRVADGISRRVDRIRSLGNAVVPQVSEWIGRRIMEATA